MQFVPKELLRVRQPSYLMKIWNWFSKCDIEFRQCEIEFRLWEIDLKMVANNRELNHENTFKK